MASRGPTSENSDMENANKPASSWPLKQGPKKWSKHGCDKGTLTVGCASVLGAGLDLKRHDIHHLLVMTSVRSIPQMMCLPLAVCGMNSSFLRLTNFVAGNCTTVQNVAQHAS